MMIDYSSDVPSPVDVLVEYLYSHHSDVGASILGDIVNAHVFPGDGDAITEICRRHLKHLPKRSLEEALEIAEIQADVVPDVYIKPNVAVYTYAAYAMYRIWRDGIEGKSDCYERVCKWLKGGVVKVEHEGLVARRAASIRNSLVVDRSSLEDFASSAVAVYDVMTAMEVIPRGGSRFESFSKGLQYLMTVYSVRTGKFPEPRYSDASSYVFRQMMKQGKIGVKR